MAQKPASQKSQAERRLTPRKQVLETFHVFVTVRRRGMRKIHLRDLSAGGLGLHIEPEDGFKVGETLDCDFYINPTLKVPLKLKIVHLTVASAGCELVEVDPKAYKAYTLFITLLDQLTEFI